MLQKVQYHLEAGYTVPLPRGRSGAKPWNVRSDDENQSATLFIQNYADVHGPPQPAGFRSTSVRPRSRVPLWHVHFSATHVRAINCHCLSVRAVSARLLLARRPLARQTCTSSFHCWGMFFYSKPKMGINIIYKL